MARTASPWSDRRTLANPAQATNIAQFFVDGDHGPLNWTFQNHMTLNHSDERYFVAETWTLQGDTTPLPWKNEFLAVAVDGSWVVRLAHHHSVIRVVDGAKVYEDEPRVGTSYDGKYAMFTSNFDNLGRDVYILKMPPLCP